MNKIKRNELKYFVNDFSIEGLIGQLKVLLPLDKNCNGGQSYVVRSLYFDSYDDECLYDKQSGFLDRRKIRMRNYGENSQTKIEIKRKSNHWVSKDSHIISTSDAHEINNGHYKCLLNYDSSVLDEIYAIMTSKDYRPKVIVEYARMAFVLPISNIRVTFDIDVSTHHSMVDFFNYGFKGYRVITPGRQVLEVKYDSFFPKYLSNVISSIATERMAISKYTLARRVIKTSKWEDN